ncbi:MAG: hypothetical protein PHU46_16200 [Rhodocyclaceae bacterium]|nr:hypothetical protein [Rhodocyclaceae bacterium]
MHQLDQVISEVRDALKFHRARSRIFLWAMTGLALAVLIVALIFAGYLIQLMQTAAAVISVAEVKGIVPSAPPDVTKIASEHTLGYIMLTPFILLLFVATGLLRHHVVRATISEDRLYHLLKVASLATPESGLPAVAQQSLLDLRENVLAASVDAEAHAGLAVVEKALQALAESVAGLKKRGAK